MPLRWQDIDIDFFISPKDLLFSACGLSILSTIICTLSTVTCSIHIFSLDLVHLVSKDTFYIYQIVLQIVIYKSQVLCKKLYLCIFGDVDTFVPLAFISCMISVCFPFPGLAGSTSLSFSQPRMHHSSGCLPDQHHGL